MGSLTKTHLERRCWQSVCIYKSVICRPSTVSLTVSKLDCNCFQKGCVQSIVLWLWACNTFFRFVKLSMSSVGQSIKCNFAWLTLSQDDGAWHDRSSILIQLIKYQHLVSLYWHNTATENIVILCCIIFFAPTTTRYHTAMGSATGWSHTASWNMAFISISTT